MGFDIRDKVVLVTGASGGIGRACAVEFHRAGARVVAAARSKDKLEELSRELGSDRLLFQVADVTRPEDRARIVEAARAWGGRIDVLVNNAGWAAFGTVWNMPPEHVDSMIRLNLTAPIAMIQAVVPEMIARGSGQVINMSSVVGSQPIARMTVYSATKHALNGLSDGLRMELRGTGVDVIVIAPSSTRTEFFDKAATVDARADRIAETMYSPERVARAVVRASRRRSRGRTLSLEGKAILAIRRVSHRLADAIMERVARRGMPMKDPKA